MTWHLVVALSATLFLFSGSARAVAWQGVSSSPASHVRNRGDSTAGDSLDSHAPQQLSSLSRSTVGVWGAGSVYPGGILGTISKGWFGLVGLRYRRLLIPTAKENRAHHDAPTLAYTADVVPIAVVSIPKGTPPGTPSSVIQSVKETGLSTYGIGIYPIGLQVGFRPSSLLRPFVAGHTGFFYFFDPVPDERGRQMNFAAGVGAGVRIVLARRTVLTLGYRYHHLSNGFRGSINPGLDANLLYVEVGLSP